VLLVHQVLIGLLVVVEEELKLRLLEQVVGLEDLMLEQVMAVLMLHQVLENQQLNLLVVAAAVVHMAAVVLVLHIGVVVQVVPVSSSLHILHKYSKNIKWA